ncbi:RsiW-degrading membrane proteinase PrsW (M82 family) [Actinoplanes campanulatus]|uniref:RsiW-degrading membrane proteinase PrsW (M82 family) n=1 Tax=Actinoplanes campanulatus TaxID=113559 RepID=A0A7W5ANN1_9ACTN|nr:PrsW family intramembrane metalloprotease [Actinoplanes campanulatus]MBB3099617.1 RsiW-degrading membrane proteinase PrsW (M82 family) [Actinoplanes campanulatus]GGN26186.1 membrane protein [Actinoplanes campanulatus]GID41509.1 membrane protein [Actinoplanes campanulatus]
MSDAVRPGTTRSAAFLRQPAFWVVITIVAAGAVRISQIAVLFFTAYPVATITAILLFALLAVPFWLFVSELDFLEREPPSLRVLAFAWGGLVATSVSIPGSIALDNLIAKLGSPDLAAEWGAALAGPTVEEIAKTLGVVAIVLIARAQVNSVLDGIVYGALVGLGFQIVEDVIFAIGAVQQAGEGDQVQPVITTFLVRGFLAGVWSHTLFGALAGAGIGYLVVNRHRSRGRRIAVAALALFAAWASHSLWNSPLFRESLGDGAPALLAVLVFKGLPPLLLVLYLVRRAHDREAAYYVGVLATVRDPALITEGELRVLGSGSRRGAARRHAAVHAGRKARSAVRRLQRAQAALAVALSRDPDGPAEAEATAVREHRATLAALGHPEAVEGARSWRHTASTVGTAALAIAVLWVALSALGS